MAGAAEGDAVGEACAAVVVVAGAQIDGEVVL
jgi:hypothetical protein